MHPALELNRLDKLPYSIRKIARSAARGSPDDIGHVIQMMMETPDEIVHRLTIFLPVFYANLYTTLPTGAELDDPALLDARPVQSALTSLDEIYSMMLRCGIPPEAFPDLWPHLWKWVKFFDAYSSEDGAVGPGFLNFADSFASHQASAKIFAATPGFRRLLTRSWEILLRSPNPMRMTLGFNALSTVLFSNTTVATTQHLEEVIEGAGGSLSDLASLVLGYINLIPPDEDRNPLLRQDTRFLGHVFDFVDDVDRLLMRGKAYPESLGPLTEELLAIGIIRSIVKVTKILTEPGAEEPRFSPLIEKSLIFLNRVLPTDLPLLVDALDSGLMYVVARCVAVSKFPKPLIFMLNNILRKCLINYYNLLILRDELPAVRRLVGPQTCCSPDISTAWEHFDSLAEERLKIFRAFFRALISDPKERRKACDNAQCGKIGAAALFKRCSCCRTSYYCSLECQAIDWHDGEHRKYCTPRSTFRLSDIHDLDSRERGFLRALLTHEYNASRYTDIYPAQFTFMAHNPDQLFVTLFDYSAGRVRIEVKPVHDPGLEQRFGASGVDGYRNDVARAARTRRMDLHVVAIPGPVGIKGEATPLYFGVPLRSETSEGHRDDIIRRIAGRYDAMTMPEPRLQDVLADMRVSEGARGSAFH